MADIFVSHSSHDTQMASWLTQALERRGFSVWIDLALEGQNLNDEIRARIREAKAVVVLLSHNSIGSQWVQGEVELAGDKAVGVRLEDFDVREKAPVRMLGTNIIDLLTWDGDDGHAGFGKIAARCAELAAMPLRSVAPSGPRNADGPAGQFAQTINTSGDSKIGVVAHTITSPVNVNL